MKHIDPILTDIARENLAIETLETRNSDDHDFYDISVWAVRILAEAARMAKT